MIGAARAILQKHNTYKNFEEEYGSLRLGVRRNGRIPFFLPRIASF
jgi:hypothetical protein